MYLRKVIPLQLAITVPIVLNLCSPEPVPADTEAELRSRAHRLAHTFLLIDTHVDTAYELQKKMADISQRRDEGHFDYVRAREGGLDAVFMAVYVPPEYEDQGRAHAFAEETIDLVNGFAQKWPDQFVLASSPEEIRAHRGSDRITILLAMENGAPIEGDLRNLKHFYDRGIRYITPVHSKNNHICDSSFDDGPKWHGLSPFGKTVVAEMNRLGLIIDVSHVSDETFYQILDLSAAPVVATHSCCRHFTPGWQRNMSDEMIRRLADKGGVMQINFGSFFLTGTANREFVTLRREIRQYVEANGLTGEQKDRYTKQRWEQARFNKTQVSDVADHIDHVVQLVGIGHVGLGSDFDGVTQLPEGLKDVSCYPNLLYELLQRGYSEADLAKICGENFLRVWAEVRNAAARPQTEGN